jgi:hypothetical protein
VLRVEGEALRPDEDGTRPAQRDVELLLPGVGLVVRLGHVIGRQVHDLHAEGRDPEAGPDELGEAVPELG